MMNTICDTKANCIFAITSFGTIDKPRSFFLSFKTFTSVIINLVIEFILMHLSKANEITWQLVTTTIKVIFLYEAP